MLNELMDAEVHQILIKIIKGKWLKFLWKIERINKLIN